MSPIKKTEPIPPVIERDEVVDTFKIILFEWKYKRITKNAFVSTADHANFLKKLLELEDSFKRKYEHSYSDIVIYFQNMFIANNTINVNTRNMSSIELLGLSLGVRRGNSEQNRNELIDYFCNIFASAGLDSNNISPIAIFEYYANLIKQSELEPVMIGKCYGFKGFYYSIKGHYADDEIRLLILEEFDKERKLFEKLKVKFDSSSSDNLQYERPRIPENVRVEVWRRDGGKCARCDSREKLEYDHIVPISKGGSNTARNIELLCERHNRSKSNNVV